MQINVHRSRVRNEVQWQRKWQGFGRALLSSGDGTFHHAVAPGIILGFSVVRAKPIPTKCLVVLLLGQCITLLPVVNILHSNIRTVRFKIFSVRCCYSISYLLLAGIYSVLSIRWYIRKGLNLAYFGKWCLSKRPRTNDGF